MLNNIYKKVDKLLSTFLSLEGLGIIIVMLMKKGEKQYIRMKEYYFYDGLLIIVFLNMEYAYNNRGTRNRVNTMITLEQKLEQYTHTYAQLKGELKWKTSDSRTGMMIAAMYASSDKLLDLGRFRN